MLLETVTGKMIDIDNPHPDQIDIIDIAWGLSRIPRFAGHTITEVPYNVAQHSLLVAELTDELISGSYVSSDPTIQEDIEKIWNTKTGFDLSSVTLKALLHDAAEVYIGDIPSPVKRNPQIYDAIKEIEYHLMATIFEKFGLTKMSPEEERVIHYADMIARAIEAHAFMQSRGREWNLPPVSLVRLQQFEPPMPSLVSYNMFLEKFSDAFDRN